MTKGGARKSSANKAIAKGMSIKIFFDVLEEIYKINDWTSVNFLMEKMPEEFGGERNETCRSYFKELWRYGLIERREKGQIILCTPENWKKGGRPEYKISANGLKIMAIPREKRVFALAWLIIQMDNISDFEQLHLALNAFRKYEVPLDMFKASKITGVVRDSIKAIMYGWLEPLGFLDRTEHGTFVLDQNYFDYVKSFNSVEKSAGKKYPNILEIKNILITTIINLPPYAPEINEDIIIPIKIKSKNPEKVYLDISCLLHPLFHKRFKNNQINNKIVILPNQEIEINIRIPFINKKVSESFDSTELGIIKLRCEEEMAFGSLPNIFLTSAAHLYEIELSNLFQKIGLSPIMFTKSDRPDMIIFPDRKESNFMDFLHNDEQKILVETTSADILSLTKIREDLKNFNKHTTKVLKIKSNRTLIVGNKIANNIEKNVSLLLDQYHPFTIITFENLKYIEDWIRKNEKIDWKYIGKILTYDGVVSKELIDSIFRN